MTLGICLWTNVLFAQWKGTAPIYYTSGNVGIGTSSPGGKLDINWAGGQLRLSGGTVPAGVWTSTTDLLYLGDWQTGTKGLLINLTSGNVGIGTNSPSARLDVAENGGGAGQVVGLRIRSGNSYNYFGNSQILFSYAGGTGYSHAIRTRHNSSAVSGNSLDFYTWKPGDAVDAVGSNLTMSLDGGNVGIGTINPQSKLEIDIGNVSSALALSLKSSGSSNHGSGPLSFSSAFTSSPFYIYSWDNELQFSQRNPDGTYKSHFMIFSNSTGNVYFPNSTGNVGIGTTTPDAKLAVKGQIHAQEVKVDLLGSIAPPDYVFASNYQLPTLDYLKTYIDQNKHLPEVPSAKEIEANGVNLGEMNMLLLKKIEELTLYQIEANRKIELLQAEIQKINNKN